jgi:hypothetical protein
MHDKDGMPTGKTFRLRPGDDPHQMANVLARDAWQARSPDVNRRLIYTVSGVV